VTLKWTRYLSLFWLLGTTFVLLSVLAGTGLLYRPDLFVVRTVQSLSSELLNLVAIFLSAIGSWEPSGVLLVALLVGLYWNGRRRLAGRLLIAFLITGLLEYMLKQFLPVPPILSDTVIEADFVPLATVDHSYPYPSGHALRSTILMGTIYLLSSNYSLRAGLALLLLGMLASRVYLGVHWASDVVGGALLGAAAVLWAFGKESLGWR
jgi:membrane-associated phospholipid phosphatase